MKLYIKSLELHLKSMLEYKTSFIISFISQILYMFTQYFVIIALFDKFGNIKGFTLYEVFLCFGIIHFGYSMAECFGRGIDQFDKLIIRGEFDRILLRPRNIILQVMTTDIDYIKLSRAIQSLIIIIFALVKLNIDWSILKVVTLALMMLSSIVIFLGLFLLAASYCFITVQALEVRNLLTDGGKHISQYPMGIFKKGVFYFFTFIIPYSFVNYFPLLYFIGKSNNKLYSILPLVVFLYLIPCIYLFNKGSKRYTSVGS